MTADIWVNWQGDEPFIRPAMISDLLRTAKEKQFDIWSLQKAIALEEEVNNPHVVKVVTDSQGKALYFSRSPIPYQRSKKAKCAAYFKHIGLYAFTAEALERIAPLALSPLEQAEGLEQLRFLENGLTIQVHKTAYDTIAIDRPEDLAKAECFAKRGVRLAETF